MLIRISLIVALVTALAVGILNFVMVKEKIETVEKHRAEEKAAKEVAQKDLSDTRRTLAKTEKDLKQTQETLATTTTERDKAITEVAALTKKATELTEKLSKTTTERDAAQQELAAFKATGRTPEQVLTLDKVIKETQEALEVANQEKKILERNLKKKIAELAKYTDPEYTGPPLPPTVTGKILVADPKWDFVVLNVGEDQGALADGELLVSRNGKLVAKIRIQSVQKDRCIANVIPSWKLGEVMEGDLFIPARPAS